MLKQVLFVFLGGGIGASLRYLVSLLFLSKPFLGTVIVNVVGSLIIIALNEYFKSTSESVRSFFRIGLLGGLTTFSTLSYEVVHSFHSGKVLLAGSILGLNIFFGIIVMIFIFR
ncbi:MAG: fluoride efflux transporter FluC [Bacteriovoracaceae bacterium]